MLEYLRRKMFFVEKKIQLRLKLSKNWDVLIFEAIQRSFLWLSLLNMWINWSVDHLKRAVRAISYLLK